MTTPVPWQLTKPNTPKVRKVDTYVRDVYNFSTTSVTQGANNPVVAIPYSGPHAAGAVNPSMTPTISGTQVIITGSVATDYGNNIP